MLQRFRVTCFDVGCSMSSGDALPSAPVTVRASAGSIRLARNGEPVSCLQLLQWQIDDETGVLVDATY